MRFDWRRVRDTDVVVLEIKVRRVRNNGCLDKCFGFSTLEFDL